MSKRKDVNIIVPTAEAEGKGLPPAIETNKEFLQKNWKYIIATWIIIVIVAYAASYLGNFLSWQLAPIPGILLSIVPSYVGMRAITQHHIKEISR